jgi:hypothetical protein
MKNRLFEFCRAQRASARSQSLAEFAIILPIFLTLMCGVIDYGYMIGNSNVMALASREGANSAARQTMNQIEYGLEAAVNAARPRLYLTSALGGVIVTKVNYIPTNSLTNMVVSTPVSNNCMCTGGIYGGGNNLLNLSRIGDPFATNLNKWMSTKRYLPVSPTNFATNQVIYVVEVFYTNQFVTPIGTLVGMVTPAQLYEAAYF